MSALPSDLVETLHAMQWVVIGHLENPEWTFCGWIRSWRNRNGAGWTNICLCLYGKVCICIKFVFVMFVFHGKCGRVQSNIILNVQGIRPLHILYKLIVATPMHSVLIYMKILWLKNRNYICLLLIERNHLLIGFLKNPLY